MQQFVLVKNVPNEAFVVERRYTKTVWLRNLRTNELHRGVNHSHITEIDGDIDDIRYAIILLRNARKKIKENMFFPSDQPRLKNLAKNDTVRVCPQGECYRCARKTHFEIKIIFEEFRAWCGCDPA